MHFFFVLLFMICRIQQKTKNKNKMENVYRSFNEKKNETHPQIQRFAKRYKKKRDIV